MPPLDLGESILQELQAIHRRLDELQQSAAAAERTWLTPSEMSKLCGVTPRTLQTYVQTGRISSFSYKKEQQGKRFTYRYHKELALRDLGA
jgi:hypothetical protein